MKEINLIQGSQEWLSWRKGKITASIAPIVMGDSPYRTKQELWKEMAGFAEPQVQNDAMKRGNTLEPIIRKMMIDKLGYDFQPKVFQSSKYEWLGCSIDGIYLYENEIIALLEIKTSNKIDHALAAIKQVPKKYVAQLQTIMEVLDFDQIIYCSYHNEELIYFDVKRDQAYIDKMIPNLKEFWDSLQNFHMPEDKYITCESDLWINHTNLWKSLQKQKKELLMQEELLRSALLSLSGGRNMKGNGLKVTQIKKSGSIDYSSIMELQGVDLEKYRKPETSYWRIENE